MPGKRKDEADQTWGGGWGMRGEWVGAWGDFGVECADDLAADFLRHKERLAGMTSLSS